MSSGLPRVLRLLTSEDDPGVPKTQPTQPEEPAASAGLPGDLGDLALKALLLEIAAGKRTLNLEVAPGQQVVLIGAGQLAHLDLKSRDRAPDRVTPREVAVLRGVEQGGTASGIAMHLGISRSTVNHHLLAARRKLGARTSTEAVSLAVERGLLA